MWRGGCEQRGEGGRPRKLGSQAEQSPALPPGGALEPGSTAESYFLSHGLQILFPQINHSLVTGHPWEGFG